jgi:hypothetical protein
MQLTAHIVENVLWNQGISFFVDWSTISIQGHFFFYQLFEIEF